MEVAVSLVEWEGQRRVVIVLMGAAHSGPVTGQKPAAPQLAQVWMVGEEQGPLL